MVIRKLGLWPYTRFDSVSHASFLFTVVEIRIFPHRSPGEPNGLDELGGNPLELLRSWKIVSNAVLNENWDWICTGKEWLNLAKDHG